MKNQLLTLLLSTFTAGFIQAQCVLNAVLFGSTPPAQLSVCENITSEVLNYTLLNMDNNTSYVFKLYRNGTEILSQNGIGLSYPLPAAAVGQNNVDMYYCSITATKVCGNNSTDEFTRTSLNTFVNYKNTLTQASYQRNSPDTVTFCDVSDNVKINFSVQESSYYWTIYDINNNLVNTSGVNSNPTINNVGYYVLNITNDCGVLDNADTVHTRLALDCNLPGSLNFSSNSHIVTTTIEGGNSKDFTIETWMRLTNANPQDYTGIVTLRSNLVGLIIRNVNGNRKLGSLNEFTFTDGPNIITNEWHHVAMVQKEDSTFLYMDGQFYFVTNTPKNIQNFNTTIEIGGDYVSSSQPRQFNGDMDEVRFWTKALSLTELQNHYQQKCPVDPQSDGLVLYYDFNQGIPGGDNRSIMELYNLVDPTKSKASIFALTRTGSTGNFTRRTPIKSNIRKPLINLNPNNNTFTSTVISLPTPITNQWHNCTANENMIGATQSTFIPNFDANYALKISNKGCTLQSNCVEYAGTNVSVLDIPKTSNNIFYPNPASTWIYSNEWVYIYNCNGQEVSNGKNYINIQNLTPGIYLVKGKTTSQKLIVQ